MSAVSVTINNYSQYNETKILVSRGIWKSCKTWKSSQVNLPDKDRCFLSKTDLKDKEESFSFSNILFHGEKVNIPQLLMSQFRWLNRIVDSKVSFQFWDFYPELEKKLTYYSDGEKLQMMRLSSFHNYLVLTTSYINKTFIRIYFVLLLQIVEFPGNHGSVSVSLTEN